MGFEVIHDEQLAGTELRYQYFTQKGQKDLPVGEAFHGHGRNKPIASQSPQHRDMAAPIDRLRGRGPLSSWRPGVETGHRLMAARFIKKYAIFRGESLDGGVERGALLLDLWPLWLGGAKRFFFAAGSVWLMPG
jgi:hypothetical protein